MPSGSSSTLLTQRDRVHALLRQRGLARLSELKAEGITATTVSRMEQAGELVRLARGLYQLPDASLDVHQSLAEASRLVPRGVICLSSALAFHGLTDQMPAQVWIAIGRKDWRPRVTYPPLRVARYSDEELGRDVESAQIAGIVVPIFGVAKTLADLFRYRRSVGELIAVEGLRQALRQRKVTPSEIANAAQTGGVWRAMQPYLMALTSDA
ncbi:type IV toxin-antitoxin system AbiEi family antitoxin domain-containing protein [Leptothrix discophora]|uniref:Type IV toxin-antitoxin system AbiEi family antitoxin domain-containing protein n=1 Tax=Leptothrix discophora TaxID=89 RepID=A0ABT9G394_LEPDI|nr:type IV toxin-antitoxin system AbiEi family antitoxin domain-containing protein [Leptothrix discophora]MDP4300938.1 type IV toxin-antitoxin system AbiEi family antitoxin domain-containing protein [Leptothrix discophora]